MSADRMPTGHSLAPLADVPDGECRHRSPELVIGCEHPVVAMPVLARRRDEIGQPVQEVKRREFDDAVGTRACGLPPAPRADPVGRLVPWQHVADSGCAAVWAASHGEPFEGKGWPGAVSQQVFEGLTIDTHLGR